MDTSILAVIITGVCTLVGTIISVVATNNKSQHENEKRDALTELKLNTITEKLNEAQEHLKEHNHYAQLFNESVPVIKEQIKVINNRIDDLEAAEKELRNKVYKG